MPALGRADLLRPLPLRQEKFPLDGWGFGEGSYVVLQALSGRDLVELAKRQGKKQVSAAEDAAYVVQLAVVDDDGRRVFDGNGDQAALLAWPAGLLRLLAGRVTDMSGMRAEGEEKN